MNGPCWSISNEVKDQVNNMMFPFIVFFCPIVLPHFCYDKQQREMFYFYVQKIVENNIAK